MILSNYYDIYKLAHAPNWEICHSRINNEFSHCNSRELAHLPLFVFLNAFKHHDNIGPSRRNAILKYFHHNLNQTKLNCNYHLPIDFI